VKVAIVGRFHVRLSVIGDAVCVRKGGVEHYLGRSREEFSYKVSMYGYILFLNTRLYFFRWPLFRVTRMKKVFSLTF
jgi:hypothetical protein